MLQSIVSDTHGGGLYSIGAVARMLGVPVSTLRTWEDRYSVVIPERSPGGHRLYSREQVEHLRFIARSVEQGMPPADAHRLLLERFRTGGPAGLTEPKGEVRLLILLAERDPYSAEFAEYFLKIEGYDTLLVMSAEEAAAGFEERSPNLAVVDLLLSGGDGYQLCRWLKERGTAPVLALSTLESREEALDAGADAFLQKPVEPLQLISTVKDLLGVSAYLQGRVRST